MFAGIRRGCAGRDRGRLLDGLFAFPPYHALAVGACSAILERTAMLCGSASSLFPEISRRVLARPSLAVKEHLPYVKRSALTSAPQLVHCLSGRFLPQYARGRLVGARSVLGFGIPPSSIEAALTSCFRRSRLRIRNGYLLSGQRATIAEAPGYSLFPWLAIFVMVPGGQFGRRWPSRPRRPGAEATNRQYDGAPSPD